jgi:sugar/nucleoside kinase (ribokinase family)
MLAREAGAAVAVDLASAAPLLAGGRRAAHDLVGAVGPDLLFTTAGEAAAFLGSRDIAGLLRFSPVAVVKRGPDGATLLSRAGSGLPVRLEIATRPLPAADTTGAGDAFDAGFLATWLALDRSTAAGALRRAVMAGHRAAARQLAVPRPELALG